ncbi:MAG: peptidylprolyl isomerase [Planctomycetota bacterium]
MKQLLWALAVSAAWVLVCPAGLRAGEKSSVDEKKPGVEKNPVVVLDTSKGAMEIELYADKAPETVKNFLGYVNDKHYDGTIFHRVMSDFVIQGGGFSEDLTLKKTKDPIKNESANGLKNEKYTVAMARPGDPHSATCQFFINVVDNLGLDKDKYEDGWGYCVFGKVVKGMEAVDAIKTVPTVAKSKMLRNLPAETVLIKSAKVKE